MAQLLLFVPFLPEFAVITDAARSIPGCEVLGPLDGYHILRSSTRLRFDRRALGLKPAIWYGVPTGGMIGNIVQFDRDTLVIAPAS